MKKIFSFAFILSIVTLSGVEASAQVNPNFTYTQTCFGNQTTLVASSSLVDTAISSWQWDLNGDGIYEKSGKMIIALLIPGNDTAAVKLKITPNSGSADSVTNNVIIDPLPNVNFMANNLCQGNTSTFISTSTISPGTITQAIWDFDNNGIDDATGDTAMYNCGPPATYSTKLKCVSNKGCVAFALKTTTIYANPVAAFSTANACVNSSASFTNTSTVTNLDFYEWNFGDGSSNSTQGNATHTYTASGTYTVQLIAVTQQGCSDTTSLTNPLNTVIISPLPTVAVSGDLTICYSDSGMLAATGGINYLWSTGETTASIMYCSDCLSSFFVTVIDGNGCSNSTSISVKVNPLPKISISGNDTLPKSGSLQLIANGANTYMWNTGETTNAITVSQAGLYTVMGMDLNNCMAKDSLKIFPANIDVVSVSGLILTPNGDGINDNLIIDNVSAYSNCDLKVYNSWNDEVFNTTGYKNDWKGTNKSGSTLPAGAYYYVIKCDDKPVSKGNINILH